MSGLRRLDGAADDGGEIDALLAQVDLAARDARHFHEVVHEPDHVVDLPVHHVVHAARDGAVVAGEPQDLQRVVNRRERRAQLVRERRQELVLAPIGFLERLPALLDRRTRRDVRRDVAEVADEPSLSVRQRDALEPPLVVLERAAIGPCHRMLAREVRLAGRQRMAEDPHDLVGVRPLPDEVHDFLEVATFDSAGMSPNAGRAIGLTARIRKSGPMR